VNEIRSYSSSLVPVIAPASLVLMISHLAIVCVNTHGLPDGDTAKQQSGRETESNARGRTAAALDLRSAAPVLEDAQCA
jgi:hypothetical protein